MRLNETAFSAFVWLPIGANFTLPPLVRSIYIFYQTAKNSVSKPEPPSPTPEKRSAPILASVCPAIAAPKTRSLQNTSLTSTKPNPSLSLPPNHLGDEVIEWNGHPLVGRTAQEVYDIVAESRFDLQIELIVARPITVNRQTAQASWRQSHSPTRVHAQNRGICFVLKFWF
jgi:hypothetical protein